MKHLIDEPRGSSLAHWTAAVVLALGPTSCATSHSPRTADDAGIGATADLATEVDALAAELTERASLRIPLGSARVLVEHPLAVRPERNRYWPEHLWAEEQHATQAALEFELEIALGDRMNVVGARSHVLTSDLHPESPLAAHSARAEHVDATHALLTTFLYDGFELELTVQLVALDSRWIIATARRRIFGYSPDAYDTPLGPAVAESTHTQGHVPAAETGHAPVVPLVPVAPVATSPAPDVALAAATPERAAPVPATPPAGRVVDPVHEPVPIAAIDGPAAMRRRALERIASEVAARVGEGVQAP